MTDMWKVVLITVLFVFRSRSHHVAIGIRPERIRDAASCKPDLVFIAFGMNECGNKNIRKNTKFIIGEFRRKGAKAVIVLGVPRACNGADIPHKEKWEYTNRELKAAALEEKCAFLGIRDIKLGMRDQCTANNFNHPGLHELELYRIAFARLVAKNAE